LSAILVPKCGVIFGAFVKPEDGQTAADAFTSLEDRSHTKFRLLHFYHQGSQLFPSDWEIQLAHEPGANRILLLNWMPEQGRSWADVAAGASDAYIDAEAAYLKSHFTDKFFLTLHHEPEEEVKDWAGSGYTAADYAAMYRHVESRMNADGVTNAVYVMNYMGAQTYALRTWYADLWPGGHFVDWIAFDPYSTSSLGGQDGGFKWMVNRHWGESAWRGSYRWAHRNHPAKPVMLAEWGIGEKPGEPHWKPWFFSTVAGDLARFPKLKAMAYFDSATPTHGGDVRPDTSEESMQAWIKLAADSRFHR